MQVLRMKYTHLRDLYFAVDPDYKGRFTVPVLFDSGIRCGADVYKALALGASAVCIGRPYVYGRAIAAADGVREVLEHFRAELDLMMATTGVTSIAEIDRSTLA